VNPIALKAFPRTFLENERQVSWLKTEKFGLIAYIEVGALGVGRIKQTHAPGSNFERGDEKGYFLLEDGSKSNDEKNLPPHKRQLSKAKQSLPSDQEEPKRKSLKKATVAK
jgi:hypothetical protein